MMPAAAGAVASREDLLEMDAEFKGGAPSAAPSRAIISPSPSPPPSSSASSSSLLAWRKRHAGMLPRAATPAPPIARLPDELLIVIFGLLDAASLCAVRRVCRAWRVCASDPMLWYSQFVRTFGDVDADAPRMLLTLTRGNPLMRTIQWDRAFAEQSVEEARIARNWLNGIGRCAEYVQFQSFVRSFCFRRDQIAVGFFDGSVCAYRFGSGQVRVFRETHVDQVVAIDMDDDTLVTGSGPPFWLDRSSVDNTVRVWDLKSDACVAICSGHSAGIVAVKLTAGLMATASRDRTIGIWARGDWRLCAVLSGHRAAITGLQWIARPGDSAAPLLLSCSQDGTVRVWHPWTGGCAAVFAFEHANTASRGVRSMHYYRGQLLVGFMSGRVMLYDVDVERMTLRPAGEYLKPGLAETRPALSVQFDHVKVAVLSGDQVVRVMDYKTARPVFNMFGLTIFASTLQMDRTRLISDGRNFIIDVHDFGSHQTRNDDPLIQVFI